MPIYIALLRGVNVSGQKIMKMEKLRRSCEAIGLTEISTYVQSGNLVFHSTKVSQAYLEKQIRDEVLSSFGFDVPVFVIKLDGLGLIIKKNPFLKDKSIDLTKLYVTFLSEAMTKTDLKALEKLPLELDQFHNGKQEIYIYCSNGYGKTKLSNSAIEKILSVESTTRNWKTINTLYSMASKI